MGNSLVTQGVTALNITRNITEIWRLEGGVRSVSDLTDDYGAFTSHCGHQRNPD